uniref:Secreted protein n=1 Tax=Steinernema glaseri TaxID=37863 RepID=A0A1I7ZP70_9BILA
MTTAPLIFSSLLLCFNVAQATFYTDRPTNLRSILYPSYSQRPISGAELYGNFEIPSMGMWSAISGYNNLLNRNLRSADEQVLSSAMSPLRSKPSDTFLYPYYSGLSKGR